ncbi:hypothetical protein PRZ48_005549 [Zasmidium cellare]|uniref:MARVEL domain-containing protein n=1 Tax=Zasmidium cellare TaxID=395010 RepID=A0ABR0EKQ1_ZASCE|nr:hypothetical protein PRZ48_005549 [Zasmidium cellare]
MQAISFSPTKTRHANEWKLHVESFYTPPFLRTIPWMLGCLTTVHVLALATGATFSVITFNNTSTALAFAHWTLIPLLALLISLLDALRLFQRSLAPLHSILTSTITLILWIIYAFLGFERKYITPAFAIIASPGLAANLAYLALSMVALKRQNDRSGKAENVELGRRARDAPRRWNRMSSGSEGSLVNLPGAAVEGGQSWSPLK